MISPAATLHAIDLTAIPGDVAASAVEGPAILGDMTAGILDMTPIPGDSTAIVWDVPARLNAVCESSGTG